MAKWHMPIAVPVNGAARLHADRRRSRASARRSCRPAAPRGSTCSRRCNTSKRPLRVPEAAPPATGGPHRASRLAPGGWRDDEIPPPRQCLLAPAVFASTAGAPCLRPPDRFRARRLHPHHAHRQLPHRERSRAIRAAAPRAPGLVPGLGARRRRRPSRSARPSRPPGSRAPGWSAERARRARLGRHRRTRRRARGSHPVLLMSPGLGATTAFMGAHASDLASHGYVVVGIDVPGETQAVDAGDGVLAPKAPAPRERVAWRRSSCARATCASCSRGSARCAAPAGSTCGASARSATPTAAPPPRTAMLADRRDPRRREPRRRDLRAGRQARPRPAVRRHARATGPAEAYASMFEFRSHLRGPRPYAHFPAPAQQLHRLRLAGPATRPRPGRAARSERSIPPPRSQADHVAEAFLRPLRREAERALITPRRRVQGCSGPRREVV